MNYVHLFEASECATLSSKDEKLSSFLPLKSVMQGLRFALPTFTQLTTAHEKRGRFTAKWLLYYEEFFQTWNWLKLCLQVEIFERGRSVQKLSEYCSRLTPFLKPVRNNFIHIWEIRLAIISHILIIRGSRVCKVILRFYMHTMYSKCTKSIINRSCSWTEVPLVLFKKRW